MKLTTKILLFILLICLTFTSLYFLLFRLILSRPIEEQKRVRAEKIVRGALTVFENETGRIATLVEDWAMWDSMYNYISHPTAAFEKDLSAPLMLHDAGLSLFLAADKNRNIILLYGYNHIKHETVTFDLLEQHKGPLWRYLNQTFDMKNSTEGVVDCEYGPLLAVSSPIFHSDNTGPQNGRLIMGRLIDSTFEKKIAGAVGENTRVFTGTRRWKRPQPPGKKTGPPTHFILEETISHMIISFPIKDAWNNDILTVQVIAQKRLFEILENAAQLFFLLLITGFVLFGIISYFIIDRLVVRRVKSISSRTGNIISFEDLSLRVPIDYRDEITLLGQNINKMLERLETENVRKDEIEHMLALNEKLIYLGRISSNIAHEVNNPLFAIANSFELIKKQLPTGDEELNGVVTMVEREIHRVRTITRNMHQLTIREIEEPSLSDISEIINAAVNVTEWSKQLRNSIVDYKKKGRSFPLYCNPTTLQQVFMNLVVNAVEAMEGEGTLFIDVNEEGDEYTVEFTDTGPGIDDAAKDTIFMPYKTTRYGKGSGLGLYISKNIILNHGGTITLDDNYKQGARLIIRLPKKGGLTDERSWKPKTTPAADR